MNKNGNVLSAKSMFWFFAVLFLILSGSLFLQKSNAACLAPYDLCVTWTPTAIQVPWVKVPQSRSFLATPHPENSGWSSAQECTTGNGNGSTCPVCFEAIGAGYPVCATSPENKVDTVSPTCGNTWTGTGTTHTLSGSADTGNPGGDSGLASNNNYTCFAGAGARCTVTISDKAGNTTPCLSPAPIAITVTATPGQNNSGTINWTISNPTSGTTCSRSSSPTSDLWPGGGTPISSNNGSAAYGPITANTTFTVSCSDPQNSLGNGSGSASVTSYSCIGNNPPTTNSGLCQNSDQGLIGDTQRALYNNSCAENASRKCAYVCNPGYQYQTVPFQSPICVLASNQSCHLDSLAFNPASISAGGNSTLSWSMSSTTSGTVNLNCTNGTNISAPAVGGSHTFSSAQSSFMCTVTGIGGGTTCSGLVSLTVTPASGAGNINVSAKYIDNTACIASWTITGGAASITGSGSSAYYPNQPAGNYIINVSSPSGAAATPSSGVLPNASGVIDYNINCGTNPNGGPRHYACQGSPSSCTWISGPGASDCSACSNNPPSTCTVTPSTQTISPGSGAVYNFSLTPNPEWYGSNASVFTGGAPAGVTYSAPSSIPIANPSGVINVTSQSSAAPGTYPVNVTLREGGFPSGGPEPQTVNCSPASLTVGGGSCAGVCSQIINPVPANATCSVNSNCKVSAADTSCTNHCTDFICTLPYIKNGNTCVNPASGSLVVSPPSASCTYAGGTARFTANDSDDGDVTDDAVWSIPDAGNPVKARMISPPGTVSCGTGPVDVHPQATYSGNTGSATLHVGGAPPPCSIFFEINPRPISGIPLAISLPGTMQFTAKYICNGPDGYVDDVTSASTWTSSLPSIATIGNRLGSYTPYVPNDKGLATAVSEGTTVITATYDPAPIGGTVFTNNITLSVTNTYHSQCNTQGIPQRACVLVPGLGTNTCGNWEDCNLLYSCENFGDGAVCTSKMTEPGRNCNACSGDNELSCSGPPSGSGNTGENLTFTATGGTGSYTYSWRGGGIPFAQSQGATFNTVFSTPGPKSVAVSDGSTTATCPVVNISQSAPALAVTLSATPASGDAPLNSTLTATVSGSAVGTINYKFWKDCSIPTTVLAEAISACGAPTAYDGVNDNSKASPFVYNSAGTYHPKILVERGSAPNAEARTIVTAAVAACSGGQTNPYYACSASTCVQVSACGGDSNGCSAYNLGLPCIGDRHKVCIGGASCGWADGLGRDECTVIGPGCIAPPACTFTASPGLINQGSSSTLTWNCPGLSGTCTLSPPQGTDGGTVPTSGTMLVSPSATTQYTLTCTKNNAPVSTSVSVRVTKLIECNPAVDPTCKK